MELHGSTNNVTTNSIILCQCMPCNVQNKDESGTRRSIGPTTACSNISLTASHAINRIETSGMFIRQIYQCEVLCTLQKNEGGQDKPRMEIAYCAHHRAVPIVLLLYFHPLQSSWPMRRCKQYNQHNQAYCSSSSATDRVRARE